MVGAVVRSCVPVLALSPAAREALKELLYILELQFVSSVK